MKILILIFVCAAVFYLGFCFSQYYKKKLLIFCDLIKLCDILTNQIRFNKSTINKIITDNLLNFSDEFKKLLISYYINNNENFSSIYLNNGELIIIKDFLNGLGKFDVQGEIENIKNQQTLIAIKKEELEIKNNKVGALGTKLGVLCALLVFVILV